MSNKSGLNQVDSEVFYGIVPVLHKERVYGFWDILLVTGAWAIATWCYVQGGYVVTLVGMKEAMTSTIFGMTLAGLILCLAVLIPTRYGIDLWIYQRALFGYIGVGILAIVSISASFGMAVVNAMLYGNSIFLIFDSAGYTIPDLWKPWVDSTCIIIGAWIALKGPIAVKRSTRIMVPCLIGVGVIIVFILFSQFTLSELASIKPLSPDAYGGPTENYMMVMEWNLSFVFAWFVALGVLARLVRGERSSYWGHVGGLAFTMAIFICIGSLTALAMIATTGKESVDPTEWLVQLGGPTLGLLSLIFIGVANITTQAVTLYSFTVSTKIIKPEWSYRKVAIFWSIWSIGLIFWGGIFEYYSVFLSIFGSICGPVIALVLTDFYLIRKQKFSMKALFQVGGSKAYRYSKGFNVLAILSLGIGIYSYFLVYNPITYTIKNEIFLYTTATGLAMMVSGGVYYVMSLFKPFRIYLLKDNVKEMEGTAKSFEENMTVYLSENKLN